MSVRRYLFVSLEGLCSDLAWRVAQEGHAVKLAVASTANGDVADGLVDRSLDWRADAEAADVIVFDDTLGQGAHAAALRREGRLVVGGTPYTDRLEDDRAFGQDELAAAGVRTLPEAGFTSFEEGIAFVRAQGGRWVFKPSGEAANIKNLVHVGLADDGSDVIALLRRHLAGPSPVRSYLLQRVAVGVEVGVTGFFDGERFLEPVSVVFEHKRLFPGDVGPMTGEMGSSMLWTGRNRLFEAVLAPMEARLREEGYHGAFDVNCIVDAEHAWPLEMTCRFGFPTICIQTEAFSTSTADFLLRLAGGPALPWRVRPGFTVGVNVRVPPYPFDDPVVFARFAAGQRVGFRDGEPRGVHVQDLKRVDGEWVLAGADACPLLVAGHGETMEAARQEAYERLRNVVLPGAYYRDDIGERWREDGDRLLAWGWLGA